jgi:hypothetical protein
LKILLNDHVLHRGHCDLKKICVCGVGEVAVNLSVLIPIESNEFVHEVFGGLLPACSVALEIRETEFGDRAGGNLGLEQIDLVQEQDKS